MTVSLLHLPTVFKNKCFEEINEQVWPREFFFTYSFDNSSDIQDLRSCGSISPKTIQIIPENLLDLGCDTIEKQNIVDLSSYSSKSYASVVLSDSKVTFLEERDDEVFRPFL